MNIDDLAVILSIDIETAKIIINSVSNYSNMMFHNMTVELEQSMLSGPVSQAI
jgi:hypothetical protein